MVDQMFWLVYAFYDEERNERILRERTGAKMGEVHVAVGAPFASGIAAAQ